MNPHPLLDLPLVTAPRLAALEDRAAAMLGTGNDVILLGAEAELPLEAVTASLGGPSLVWLNVVTSPYGRMFGDMLRARGATVHDLAPPSDRPVRAHEVGAALSQHPQINALAIVHAEALTGIVNPLPEILELAGARAALTVVDAVASAGAEPLDVDALGIDVCVVGPQKGWGGPAGVSVVSVSERAWQAMRANPLAVRRSVLSLLDIKESWIDRGRTKVRGTPPPLELAALAAAFDRLDAEGMDRVVERHRVAAQAARAGVQGLGLSLWVADEHDAAAIATPVRLPAGVDADALAQTLVVEYGIDVVPGTGELAGIALRLNHMGSQASFVYVASAIVALGSALSELEAEVDVAAGSAAVAERYILWRERQLDPSTRGQRLAGA